MLKSERMRKVVITVPNSFLEKTINELYKLNAVHIIDHFKDDLDIGSPFKNASKVSEALIAVRALISNLGLTGSIELNNGFRAIGVKNFSHLSKSLKMLQEETNSKLEKIKQVETEAINNEIQRNMLLQLGKFDVSVEYYRNYSSIAVFTGYVDDPALLKQRISKETDEFEIMYEEGTAFIALFVPVASKGKATDILEEHGFIEIDLSPIKEMKGKPSEILPNLSAKHERLLKSKLALQKQLNRLGMKRHDFLLLSEKFLSMELEKVEAPLRFASSENISVVTGWMPLRNTEKVVECIQRITEGKVDIEVKFPLPDEEVPVKLSNIKPAKPFEFLLKLYALPKYSEIDPTLFLFITFPLFFGIILGDIGYGAVTFLLFLYLSKKFPFAAPLVKVMIASAFSSIIFGFLFGEFFGFEELFGYHLPHLISRVHQVQEMLIISIIIGLFHINMGLFLGFINEMHHSIKKAILAKASWWLLQLSVAGVAASANGLLNIPMYLSGILALVAVVMLAFGEPRELIEIPMLFSNVLSYSRLVAVGLASVGLAAVINGFVEEFANAGGFMILVAILVGILGHTINIALGLLGGFLQSLRLHYVEFFTKFFKGGATPFQSFGKTLVEVN